MMHWYILRSKHRNEDLLCHQLQHLNVEVYYPSVHKQTVRQHTRKMKPYFPGYLFVHIDLDTVGISDLQWLPGGMGVVCFGGEAAWVSDAVLHAIRARVEEINAAHTDAKKNLRPGDEIEIHSGPFAGYTGIFATHLSDRERVTVLLNFVRDQQIRVELPAGDVHSTKGTRS